MKYVFAVLCPPVAILLCGKPFQALVSLAVLILASVTLEIGVGEILLAFIWIWAFRVVADCMARDRVDRRIATW